MKIVQQIPRSKRLPIHEACMWSVKNWADSAGCNYEWVDEEFNQIHDDYRYGADLVRLTYASNYRDWMYVDADVWCNQNGLESKLIKDQARPYFGVLHGQGADLFAFYVPLDNSLFKGLIRHFKELPKPAPVGWAQNHLNRYFGTTEDPGWEPLPKGYLQHFALSKVLVGNIKEYGTSHWKVRKEDNGHITLTINGLQLC